MNRLHVAIAVLLTSASSLQAGTWAESGDAGDLTVTGQSTVGGGSLTAITGTLSGSGDKDLFAIVINDKANFFANITPLVQTIDPDIYLFSPTGLGIAHNDIVAGGACSISGALVPANGVYYLGISSDGADALSSLGPIWSNSYAGARAPDGPGAAGPLIGWGGTPALTMSNYTITLSGATFALVPEPSSLAAIALGAAAIRRRR